MLTDSRRFKKKIELVKYESNIFNQKKKKRREKKKNMTKK